MSPAYLSSARDRLRDGGRHGLARLQRMRLARTTFIGITGSAGKTTTKTLLAGILAARGPCQSSPGTGNEHRDVEWTLLRTRRHHEFCVVEVGAPEPGYLDRSLRALRPRIGVLTLAAPEHKSAYHNAQAVAAEKGKLVAALPHDGIAVLNVDDPLIRSIGERRSGRIVWFGQAEGATIRLLEASSIWPVPLSLRVRFEGADYTIATRLHGVQLTLPVLAALGAAVAAGVPLAGAIDALARLEPVQGRMQIETSDDGVTFVRDDWKAPEWSLEAPLEFMRTARSARKVVVMGTICDSKREDARRYARAARLSLAVADLVVLVGTQTLAGVRARAIRDDGSLQVFRSVRDAADFLRQALRPGDLVLLKGTNKQDHLVRLVLDRNRPVACWEPTCGRHEFCGSCPRLYASPAATDTAPAPAADESRATWAGRALPLLVGLGNQGSTYRNTRHNVGHRVLDTLAESTGARWQAEALGAVASTQVEGVPLTLFKPGVNVNDSGPVVRRALDLAGGTAGDCIVVLDDLDIPLGQIRVKHASSDAGHKGMRSIIAALGTEVVPRIRIGARGDGETRRAIELVLKDFSSEEEASLAQGLRMADEAIRKLLAGRKT